jgi:Asp-tRNA(Asn)/Glu-tRNA(Gln) amidotransferase A subunit family amidase
MKHNPCSVNRRRFIGYFSAAGLSTTLLPGALAAVAGEKEKITVGMIAEAEKIAGLSFTDDERKEMAKELNDFRDDYETIRALKIDNSVPPALYFDPIPPGKKIDVEPGPFRLSEVNVPLPEKIGDLAFHPVTHLARLIEERRITSLDLTKMYLARLKKYDPILHCVVTLTEDLALKQAKRADEEIAQGKYRGTLHGIPWGAKDLFAVRGYRTTWGAHPYKEQVIDTDAAVVERLEEAGAVLVAKLTLGALAMGDHWFGGVTRNPWNVEQGSSGSSAGPASAVAAGLVGFAIGTETRGSIISPSRRCGVTALRPTFGRVSRYGAMALSWSMDKIGPMCRTVEDCAAVFDHLHGKDPRDLATRAFPFHWEPGFDVKKLTVGYSPSILELKEETDSIIQYKRSYESALNTLKKLCVDLVPKKWPDFPVNALGFILTAEAAAAFDELTVSKRDRELTSNAWASRFRLHRFVPAVEYIQANRARTLLIQEMDRLFEDMDLYMDSHLGITNLTGHPEVVLPNGFRENGTPYSVSFTGKLFGESKLLCLAHHYQQATGHHLKHPELPE